MNKAFCDMCGVEITDANRCSGGAVCCKDTRLGAELKRGDITMRIEIMTAMNGTANAGDFCKHCVLDALYKLDDRPKVEPAAAAAPKPRGGKKLARA